MGKYWKNPKDDEFGDFIRCALKVLPVEEYGRPAYRVSIKPDVFVDFVHPGDDGPGIPYLNGIAGINPHGKEKAPGAEDATGA